MILNKTIKIGALFTALILMLTGCSINNKTLEKSQKNEDVLVTLILDKGGVNDGSFNESAWSGAERASKELGIEVKYLESNTDADYVQNIETAIDLESDLIIGVGFNLSKAIEDAAKSYPKQQFAIVDGSFEEIPSNVTPIVFDEKEAGYLAGIVVAKTVQSDSNKFGFIGGFEVPAVINYRDGFEKGLLEVNPNATLLTQYANSFTDIEKERCNSVLFMGQSGCGKSHLSLAIANTFMKNGIGVVYMNYREDMTYIKQNILDCEVYNKYLNRYKNARVLLIDDLFKGNITPSDINIIFEIINYRYFNNKPIIVSTEKYKSDLLKIDEAIGSRILEMCDKFNIEVRGKGLNDRIYG